MFKPQAENLRWSFFKIKPFSTNVPLLHPLKTSEILRFSSVFRGYESEIFVENESNNG